MHKRASFKSSKVHTMKRMKNQVSPSAIKSRLHVRTNNRQCNEIGENLVERTIESTLVNDSRWWELTSTSHNVDKGICLRLRKRSKDLSSCDDSDASETFQTVTSINSMSTAHTSPTDDNKSSFFPPRIAGCQTQSKLRRQMPDATLAYSKSSFHSPWARENQTYHSTSNGIANKNADTQDPNIYVGSTRLMDEPNACSMKPQGNHPKGHTTAKNNMKQLKLARSLSSPSSSMSRASIDSSPCTIRNKTRDNLQQ